MKIKLPGFFYAAAAVLIAAAVLQLSAAGILRGQLKRVFPGARVKVSGCSLWPLSMVTARGVQIDKAGIYRLSVGRSRLRYNLMPVNAPLVSGLWLEDVVCQVDSPGARLSGLWSSPGRRSSAGRVLPVEWIFVERCRIAVNTIDLQCDAVLSGAYDLGRQRLERADISLRRLVLAGLSVERVAGSASWTGPAPVSAASVSLGRAQLRQLSAVVSIRGDTLMVSDGTASLMGGKLAFNGLVQTRPPWNYRLECRLNNLDLDIAANELKWNEKVRAAGLLSGSLQFEGAGSVPRIAGRLEAAQPGGSLSILDRKFLEYISGRSQQPVELLAESFRDYRYDSAGVDIATFGSNLMVTAAFEGAQGKRGLTVVLHDFK